MNNFCWALTDSLRSEFGIEVDVFVSRKKKVVHMSLLRPLFSYKFFNDIVRFLRTYWSRRQKLYTGYFFVNPILNQSIKWRFDYIIVNNDEFRQRKKKGHGRFAR